MKDVPWIDGAEDNGATFRAVWRLLEDYGTGGPPLYPHGLYDLLKGLP